MARQMAGLLADYRRALLGKQHTCRLNEEALIGAPPAKDGAPIRSQRRSRTQALPNASRKVKHRGPFS